MTTTIKRLERRAQRQWQALNQTLALLALEHGVENPLVFVPALALLPATETKSGWFDPNDAVFHLDEGAARPLIWAGGNY